MPTIKLLIVDDSRIDYELTARALKNIPNIEFVHSLNFADFKQKFVPNTFDAVISDYNLGNSFGTDIYLYIKSREPDMPFIIVTGSLGEEQAVEILRLGVTDYILKEKIDKLPFTLQRALKAAETAKTEKLGIQKLKESEEKFRKIFESIVDVYYQTDNNGLFTVISNSFYQVSGYQPFELIGKPVSSIYEKPETRNALLEKLHKEKQIFNHEVTILGKAGNPILISANINLVFDEEGRTTGVQGIFRDITEKKKQQEALIISEQKLKEAHQLAKLGHWEFNPYHKTLILSDQIYDMVEIDREQFSGLFEEFFNFIHPEDLNAFVFHMFRALKSDVFVPMNFRVKTKQEQEKHITGRAIRIEKPDGSYRVTGTLQDISELKTLEKEKNEMQQKALSMLEGLVEQRTLEIVKQREIIQEKNKDITDSIQYAKRLQNAILPSTDIISSVIPRHFILYHPKDIVAGDFYWAHKKDDVFIVAAADCTGHGVPGAMVSLVCSNALDRAVNEFGILEPGLLLDKVTELITQAFEKSGQDVNDGMDISLLYIDQKNRIVKWAGANNPLYYMQNGELVKIKANKQPVGKFFKREAFTTHTFDYVPNTCYYLITDGFADQFGGSNGKRFKQSQLNELLCKIKDNSVSVQQKTLNDTFIDWKGQHEQVDDVTLISLTLH